MPLPAADNRWNGFKRGDSLVLTKDFIISDSGQIYAVGSGSAAHMVGVLKKGSVLRIEKAAIEDAPIHGGRRYVIHLESDSRMFFMKESVLGRPMFEQDAMEVGGYKVVRKDPAR
jgi:hypothetical protein